MPKSITQSTPADRPKSAGKSARNSRPARSTKTEAPVTKARKRLATKGTAAAAKIEVRNSPIHGRGVYAARKIRRGERIIEYTGRLISWKEADRVPPSDPNDPHHTFLFSLSDGKRVIDANSSRNAARWINHSCDPNCETEENEDGRVFIEALRDIPNGEELHYDYCLVIDEKITKKLKRQYQCLCGAEQCRGTMLALKKKKKKKKD
jgi:SET domain-containing protein